MTFERPLLRTLLERLQEPRNRIHILSGPRQVGKTTLSMKDLEKIEDPKVQAIKEVVEKRGIFLILTSSGYPFNIALYPTHTSTSRISILSFEDPRFFRLSVIKPTSPVDFTCVPPQGTFANPSICQ